MINYFYMIKVVDEEGKDVMFKKLKESKKKCFY